MYIRSDGTLIIIRFTLQNRGNAAGDKNAQNPAAKQGFEIYGLQRYVYNEPNLCLKV